ncbi:MAG TPA: dihydropteroate synthase [Xanthobacteraceae bacterium]|nr:dihydropteroate synthase [Xanthobacteraceae bacterium]
MTAASPQAAAFLALLERPAAAVMGILNLTPDSFSDGGQFAAPDRALAHARQMIAAGADILDVGAVSSRPYDNNVEPPAEEELRRLAPVLRDVVALGLPVSIDTMQSRVARYALECGVGAVNDVWGLQRDLSMADVVAEFGASVIVMHNRLEVDPMLDIMADVTEFLSRSIEIALRAGVPREHIVLDPGIGFGKTPEQSMTVLARLEELHQLGLPLLVGASRKRFIASVVPSEPQERLGGSLAAHLISVQRGAKIIRAHDVAETVQALRVAAAIESNK